MYHGLVKICQTFALEDKTGHPNEILQRHAFNMVQKRFSNL